MSLLLMLVSGAAHGESPPAVLAVSISPGEIDEVLINCPITSSLIVATGSGGAEPYSYAWDWSFGGTGITINSPLFNNTSLTKAGAGIGTGTLRCTVTDDDLNTATNTISITLECGT